MGTNLLKWNDQPLLIWAAVVAVVASLTFSVPVLLHQPPIINAVILAAVMLGVALTLAIVYWLTSRDRGRVWRLHQLAVAMMAIALVLSIVVQQSPTLA